MNELSAKRIIPRRLVRAAVLAAITAAALYGNDAIFQGNGVTVFPVKSADIQMVTDSVTIKRGGELGWLVEVVATFKNFGPEAAVQVGFPFEYSSPETLETEFPGEYPVRPNFKAFVDGRPVPVTPKRGALSPDLGLAYDLVYVFPVTFRSGETTTIRQTYTVGGTQDSMGGNIFSYILKTGALWKDSIQRLSIVFELEKKDAPYWQSIIPVEHRAEERDGRLYLSWSYENIEPDFDLKIEHMPTGLSDFPLDELIKQPDFALGELLKRTPGADIPLQPAWARYLRNLTYARYGYPFKNAYVRAQFYGPGALTENPGFQPSLIKPGDQAFIASLNRLEKEDR